MKSTGIFRKIDGLGRIVIPKEIRKNLNIKENDNLEIFIQDESVILKKYSILNNYNDLFLSICDSVYNFNKKNIIITDLEHVICTDSFISSKYNNLELPLNYVELLNKRDFIVNENIFLNFKFNIAFPIIINGDLYGSVILCSDVYDIDDTDRTIGKFILKFLEKNIED